MKATKSAPLKVGECFVFLRDEHQWDGCEVVIIAVRQSRYKVARCCHLCEALLSPRGSKKRQLTPWMCSRGELW